MMRVRLGFQNTMSVHYFIDGYNLIRSAHWRSAGNLDADRDQLVRFIDERGPTGSERNGVTIVFDGKPGRRPPPAGRLARVVFSFDIDADTEIKRRVDAMPNPTIAMVVTDDRAIQRWIRGAGARVMTCEAFLSGGRRPPKRGREKTDPTSAAEINREMRRIWGD